MKEHDEKMAELEIKELKEKAGITKNVRQKRRYDVIRLSLQGYSNNEISKILDISLRQVYNLINLYKENGIEGLKLKYSPGRKTKLTAEQEKELYDVITKKLPKDVGFELAVYFNVDEVEICINLDKLLFFDSKTQKRIK